MENFCCFLPNHLKKWQSKTGNALALKSFYLLQFPKVQCGRQFSKGNLLESKKQGKLAIVG